MAADGSVSVKRKLANKATDMAEQAPDDKLAHKLRREAELLNQDAGKLERDRKKSAEEGIDVEDLNSANDK